ncbi:hypothetical protein GCM10011369_32450 [Neiella marina]|uniref:Uncharacterized protein n=1 Tax=Neiella marina TaxID=508461 RepID=A0A8J2U982_9GAMM|nr:hypothetical protein [Neiella marina]GGA87879.1 hypothetical protein GCM10011369_32450 [Neiella marina]
MRGEQFKSDFKEKHLIGMFDISLNYNSGYRHSIDFFFHCEKLVADKLEFIVANFDLSDNKNLWDSIIKLLSDINSNLSKGNLELYSQSFPNSELALKVLKQLKEHNDGDQFLESYDNILDPILIFGTSLPGKWESVQEIKASIEHVNTA